jgi:hypothetical protein
MMATIRLRPVTLLIASLAVAWLAHPQGAAAQRLEGAFERTLAVTGAADLDARSGSGAIRVQPGAAGSVHVAARIKADNSWLAGSDVEQRIRRIEQNPPIEQQGNTIRIGRFADDSLPRNISISYDITVPADTKLAAGTGSGSIEIGAIKGPIEVKSGSGSIEVGRVGGPVLASAGSGSIRVDGASGLDAHTGSGSIHAGAIAGPAKASSGSGSITITQAGAGEVEASTGSGGITLTGVNGAARVSSGSGSVAIEGRPAGAWSLHSASGGVTMTLPPDAAFDLDARTSSGSIDSVHPVTMTVMGKIDKRHVEGKVRGGGPLVQVSCSSGSIRIR